MRFLGERVVPEVNFIMAPNKKPRAAEHLPILRSPVNRKERRAAAHQTALYLRSVQRATGQPTYPRFGSKTKRGSRKR